MNNKQLITTNQDSKVALIKSKNLLDITSKILNKKDLIKSFEFKPYIISQDTYGVDSISISPSEKYIVSGSSDRTIKIWDFKTGECLKNLEGHVYNIN